MAKLSPYTVPVVIAMISCMDFVVWSSIAVAGSITIVSGSLIKRHSLAEQPKQVRILHNLSGLPITAPRWPWGVFPAADSTANEMWRDEVSLRLNGYLGWYHHSRGLAREHRAYVWCSAIMDK